MNAFGNIAGWAALPAPPRPARAAAAWRAPLEGAGLLALLLLLDATLFEGDRFATVAPHPFGAVVLLVAAQYGVLGAAATALLATLALYLGAVPEQAFGQDRYEWLLAAAREPLLWFGTALVVGGIAGRHRRRVAEAEAAAVASRAELARMVAANDRLRESVTAMDAAIAGETRTVTTVLDAARGLVADPAAALRAAPALLQAATGCNRCSLFRLEGGAFVLAAREGWTAGDRFAERIGPGHPLHAALVSRRTPLVAARGPDRAALQGEGLLAAPVLLPDGRLWGAAKIEDIPFPMLTLGTLANLAAVAGWLGEVLAVAEGREAAPAAEPGPRPATLLSPHLREVRP